MKTTIPKEESPAPDSLFLGTLQRHRGGALLAHASERLRAVVAGVHGTGKTGSMTITLVVKPAQRGQNAVVFTDSVKAKIPALESEASFWFATPEGALEKNDPRQREFAIEAMGGAKAEPAVPAAKAAKTA
jgi:hypothetical protein